ncbi:hypothetical protein PGTUg99_019112 [Puccinia graminis f. sp. tritici]|uniref:Uncharacterized protein n=1 Tax=Puccinia graminis f. sp. tritici TaxID=56615 RepID=A0A5B0N0M0_PUCGR|nr:hypothetical protein PGTUg99_019112 [Puccinia graminis f. sp. tritici]
MQQVLLLSVLLFASLSVGEEPARTELAAGNSVPKAGKYAAPTRKSVAKAVKRLFDFALTPDMKTADLDVPKSAVNKLIGYVVKGPAGTQSSSLEGNPPSKLVHIPALRKGFLPKSW